MRRRNYLYKKNFNSRPCGRGFPDILITEGEHVIFQFTPLREGLLVQPKEDLLYEQISIHAPAGGASSRL